MNQKMGEWSHVEAESDCEKGKPSESVQLRTAFTNTVSFISICCSGYY